MKLVGAVDSNALARYASTWVRWRKISAILDQAGPVRVFRHADGTIKDVQPNALVSVERGLSEQLTKLEAAFGMNPAARSRINVAPPAESDELADFIRRGRQ